jgi:hypothetical protein
MINTLLYNYTTELFRAAEFCGGWDMAICLRFKKELLNPHWTSEEGGGGGGGRDTEKIVSCSGVACYLCISIHSEKQS